MERIEIESAISELEILIDKDPLEYEFQDWFEKNPIIFKIMGYKKHIAHPELKFKNINEKYVPDFIVQGHDNLWEIFEIKRSNAKLLKNKRRRNVFYSELDSHISQCFEYSEYFDDQVNRDYIEEQYSINVNKSPKSILIAGINDGFNHHESHRIIKNRPITILTYDDIKNTLEFYRAEHYAKYEELTGLSIKLILKINKIQKENFIFDIGKNINYNRISLFVDNNNILTFRIIDKQGDKYQIKIKEGENGFHYGKEIYLSIEFGIAKDYGIVTFEIDGKYFKDLTLQDFEIDYKDTFRDNEENRLQTLIGSDLTKQSFIDGKICHTLIKKGTSTFEEKKISRFNYFNFEGPRKGLNFDASKQQYLEVIPNN